MFIMNDLIECEVLYELICEYRKDNSFPTTYGNELQDGYAKRKDVISCLLKIISWDYHMVMYRCTNFTSHYTPMVKRCSSLLRTASQDLNANYASSFLLDIWPIADMREIKDEHNAIDLPLSIISILFNVFNNRNGLLCDELLFENNGVLQGRIPQYIIIYLHYYYREYCLNLSWYQNYVFWYNLNPHELLPTENIQYMKELLHILHITQEEYGRFVYQYCKELDYNFRSYAICLSSNLFE